MNQETKRTVTLEDLLRLKRAERPAPEFWDQFDRELRVKQLAALVEKRPWWKLVLPRASALVGRYYLPLGAGAVFAVAFVTMRGPSEAPQTASLEARVAIAGDAARTISDPATLATPVALATARDSAPVGTETQVDASAAATADSAVEQGAAAETSTSASPLFATLHGVEEPTPSARFIAANLAAVQAADPTLAATFRKSGRGAESRLTQAVEPLSMISPAEARIARISSPMLAAFTKDTFSRTSERIARRLSEARMRDETRRFGATGNSLAVSF
jgi:hypothetical protein